MEAYPSYTLYSSVILLICAALIQCIQDSPNGLSVAFLFLGTTSVIHHSRLHKWWINDVWRFIDLTMVFLFFICYTRECVACRNSIHLQIWCFCLILISLISVGIRKLPLTNYQTSLAHCIMHYIVIFAVVFYSIDSYYRRIS